GDGRTCMIARFFVDTNILIHAYDLRDPTKRARALELLARLGQRGVGVISTQVLAEFFLTVTRRTGGPILSDGEAYARLENYIQSWSVVDVTPLVVLEAARGVVSTGSATGTGSSGL